MSGELTTATAGQRAVVRVNGVDEFGNPVRTLDPNPRPTPTPSLLCVARSPIHAPRPLQAFLVLP